MHSLFHFLLLIVAVWSGFAPLDRFTWYLEVIPGFIGWGVLLWLRKVRISFLLQLVIVLHIIILFVGGHYTYSEVPGFAFNLPFLGGVRNHYDKLGHFMQGLTPALITREVILRKRLVNGGNWISFFSVSVALAFSAFYELVEWWVSVSVGEGGDAFLGTQGYVWDTQSDMLMALLGGIFVVVLTRKKINAEK
jgi:putative membrane protein